MAPASLSLLSLALLACASSSVGAPSSPWKPRRQLQLPTDPCANPVNICCNPTANPPQKCPGDVECPKCGKTDCVCPLAPPPPPPEPRPRTPGDLGADCEPCTDVAWNNTNLSGEQGDGCDVNSTLSHPGIRVHGTANDCCAACMEARGCTGYTWDSNGGGWCYLKHVPKCNSSAPQDPGQFTASATLKVAPTGVPLDGFVPGQCIYKH